jgi:Sigma 54 modulation protein / S30EA ribosomal protein.
VRYPVLGARIALTQEPNPRLERPARAEGELNVNGNRLRGRVAGASMKQAIDELVTHLERQLQDFGDRRARLTRRAHQPAAGEWHHAAWSPPRPSYYPRPVEERSIVRRKTFALDELDPLQAVVEMLDLDHDFYLFRDARSAADTVAYRRDDGRVGLI